MDLRLTLSGALSILHTAGPLGYVLFLACFSAWVTLALPTTPIELASGYIYGPVWGTISGLFCKTVGSYAALIIARFIGRRRGWGVPPKLQPQLEMLHSHPIAAMVSIRLAPLPLAVKNYGLALTDVSSWTYIVAAVIVNGPFSFMWGTIGASCQSLAEAMNFNASSASSNNDGLLRYCTDPKVACTVLVMVIGGIALSRRRSKAGGVCPEGRPASDEVEQPGSRRRASSWPLDRRAVRREFERVARCLGYKRFDDNGILLEANKSCAEVDRHETSASPTRKDEVYPETVSVARRAVAICEQALQVGREKPGTPGQVLEHLERARNESQNALHLARRALIRSEMRAARESLSQKVTALPAGVVGVMRRCISMAVGCFP